ncbi:MAG TPA: lactonase family protein [Acidobacteriaceae bacterium]|nr:lactonase family protein [Acidobacteriaceae bacterium]
MKDRKQMTRRRFTVSAAAWPLALRGVAEAQAGVTSRQGSARWVLLGTDTGKGIYRALWNPVTGLLGSAQLAVETVRPAFLARHPSLPVVYAANSASGAEAGVSSFALDLTHGGLTALNRVGSQGDGPCFVSADATGTMAFVANYAGGSFAAFRLTNTGGLAQAIGVFKYNQPTHGPVAERQEGAHMHCATVAPGNSFVISCDLGDDVLLVFPVGPGRGDYVRVPTRVAARPGSGPRHVAFHPNGEWVYCIHELDCTIDLYDWRVERGTPAMRMREGSTVSTLAHGASLTGNTACEIVVSDDGRFVYACTRGEDSIVVYSVDASTGLLTEQQRLKCGGNVPRYIGFDPSRRWLLCCNQGSSTVTTFSHDPATGKLGTRARTSPVPTPMFALWV